MSSLLNPGCLDRLAAALSGIAGVAGVAGVTGAHDLAIGAGLLGIACSGGAELGARLEAATPEATRHLNEFVSVLRDSWSDWTNYLSQEKGYAESDLEVAAAVFDRYFSDIRRMHLPTSAVIIESGLNADALTSAMLDHAAATDPGAYADRQELHTNRQFFLWVINSSLARLLTSTSFADTLMPAFMSWSVDKANNQGEAIDTIQRLLEEQFTKSSELITSDEMKKLLQTEVAAILHKELLDLTPNGETNSQILETVQQRRADEAAQLSGNSDSELKDRASVLRSQGALAFTMDMQKAIGYFKEAVVIWPADIESWAFLGHVYSQVQSLDQAEAAYRTVAALAPHQSDRTHWAEMADDQLQRIQHERRNIEAGNMSQLDGSLRDRRVQVKVIRFNGSVSFSENSLPPSSDDDVTG